MLFVLFVSQSFISAQENTDVIATVNGRNITKTYVNKVLQQDVNNLPENQKTEDNINMLVNKIVNQKVEELLLIDAAKKANVEVSKDSTGSSTNPFSIHSFFNITILFFSFYF